MHVQIFQTSIRRSFLCPTSLPVTLTLCLEVVTRAVSQFQLILRKRIHLESSEAIFLFVETVKDGKKNHTLLPARFAWMQFRFSFFSEAMVAVYNAHRDEDGFLYFVYSNDDVFG
jgi:GABA(A) receptor-associated protein